MSIHLTSTIATSTIAHCHKECSSQIPPSTVTRLIQHNLVGLDAEGEERL